MQRKITQPSLPLAYFLHKSQALKQFRQILKALKPLQLSNPVLRKELIEQSKLEYRQHSSVTEPVVQKKLLQEGQDKLKQLNLLIAFTNVQKE